MKTILLILSILLVLAVSFVMYCCIRVGEKEDAILEKMRERKENETGLSQ